MLLAKQELILKSAGATAEQILAQEARVKSAEANVNNYSALIAPFLTDKADIVYGSRYMQSNSRQVHRFWHTFFNKLMTYFSNALSNVYLTDMHTCYITFNRKVLEEIAIGMTSQRFGFNPEFAARMAKKNYKVIEVPITAFIRHTNQNKLIKVKTKTGREIKVTKSHSLFILDSESGFSRQ